MIAHELRMAATGSRVVPLKDGTELEVPMHTEITTELFRSIRACSPSRINKIRPDLKKGSPLAYQAALFEPYKDTADTLFGKFYEDFLLKQDTSGWRVEEEWINPDERPKKYNILANGDGGQGSGNGGC